MGGEASADLESRWIREQVRERLFGEAEPVSVGRYALRAPLGRGGMATVYAATDPVLEREVAVKILHPRDAHDARRLLREGRALAAIAHPNVVAVHDAGVDGDCPYLVMEKVEGQTLDAYRRAQPDALWDVLDAVLGAGSGLAAAHGRGLVHRDVKPQNILVDARGVARLSDFGLTGAEPSGAPSSETSARLTVTGALLGTPAYMSPEQLDGLPADPRSDQFALCVTLYECVCGARPFDGETPAAIRAAIAAGAPDAPEDAPSWLLVLIARGLREDPEERYPSVDALLSAIAARRESVRKTEHAMLSVDRLSRAFADRAEDPERLLSRVATCREELRDALADWPDNPEAQDVDARLAALGAAIEREHDPTVGDGYKAVWGAVIAVLWVAAYAAFAWGDASGAWPIDNRELTVFFGVFLALNLFVTYGPGREIHRENDPGRKLSLITTAAYAGDLLAAAVGWALDADVAMTLASVHVVAGAIWGAAAIGVDRRVAVLSVVTALGGAVMALFPAWCFEIAAVVATLGIGGFAYAMRPRKRDLS
ncbi:MAG: serine/threonine-protein kinase [Sandaracinaceae bacterium]